MECGLWREGKAGLKYDLSWQMSITSVTNPRTRCPVIVNSSFDALVSAPYITRH